MSTILFDIETGPLEDEILRELMPPFDVSEVKTGNLGEEKAQEKIEAAREAHERRFIEKAALNPVTGQVLVIGVKRAEDGRGKFIVGDEKEILAEFWEVVYQRQPRLAGWNIHDFDIPFLYRRSWLTGVQPPPAAMYRDRYWPEKWVDLRKRWLCTRRPTDETSSLDYVAKALGLEGKLGSGADFARLWEEDRKAAKQYLKRDLDLIHEIAVRLGAA